jgi:hypothetical protein
MIQCCPPSSFEDFLDAPSFLSLPLILSVISALVFSFFSFTDGSENNSGRFFQ